MSRVWGLGVTVWVLGLGLQGMIVYEGLWGARWVGGVALSLKGLYRDTWQCLGFSLGRRFQAWGFWVLTVYVRG